MSNRFRFAPTLALAVAIATISMEPSFAAQSPLVTGNGFGYAVVSPTDGTLTKFYAHPYMFTKPDPKDPFSEGIPTPNLIKSLKWNRMDENFERKRAGDSQSVEVNLPQSIQLLGDGAYGPQNCDYLGNSNIIIKNRGRQKEFFVMPFGIDRCILLTSCVFTQRNASPIASIEWAHSIKSVRTVNQMDGHTRVIRYEIISFQDIDETILLIPLQPGAAACATTTTLSGAQTWALVSISGTEQANTIADQVISWADTLGVGLIGREFRTFEQWRKNTVFEFDDEKEKKLWRQSETVLRMAQCREPNREDRHNHGLIMAVLPDSAWSVCWVRDMTYATVGLIRMGHQTEARNAVEAFFNTQPVGKMQDEVRDLPYQVSVARYFGDGSEEPFFTQEGSNNVELDDWGLVLWALGEYDAKFHDDSLLSAETYRGKIYDSAKKYVVEPLLGNLDPYKDGLIVTADTSIWEERQKDQKHFAFSTAIAIKGLEGFIPIAERQHDELFVRLLRDKVALLRKGFNAAFVVSGRLRGTLEDGIKNDIDGANICSINLGVVKDDSVIRKTIDSMESMKMPSGGYKRVRSIVPDPAIFEYWYERQEFLLVDFMMAESWLHLGEPNKADALISSIVERASRDHFFVPEMYVSEKNYRFTGEVGQPTGAIPMVGYGAGAYVTYIVNREATKAKRSETASPTK